MTPQELKRFVKHVRNSYGRQMVSQEILDFLISQVSHIPSEAVTWIRDDVLQKNQKCPEVLHTAILNSWYAWRSQHPDKCTGEPEQRQNCVNPYCREGWFRVFERDKGLLSVRYGVCGECKRLGSQMANGLTRNTAQAKGYLLPTAALEAEYKEQQDARA